MNLIGFSHHYKKLHGQESGTLISVEKIEVSEKTVPFITRVYDTEYIGVGGCSNYHPFKYGVGDMCLRLTFIGNLGIPFTTYRDIPEEYWPFGKTRGEYRFSLPYAELLKQNFAFKFKGEPMSDLCKTADGIRIIE